MPWETDVNPAKTARHFYAPEREEREIMSREELDIPHEHFTR
ncbi:hypothetical protein BH11ARM1_BH11ARM1_01750 [soil metagenome]